MIKVGILPTCELNQDNNPYNNIYLFSNAVAKNIYKAGAIPVGILLNDGNLDIESLKMCDAFVICGGKKIESFFFKAIKYAIDNNKPLLGICLGMQTIGVYAYLEELIKENNEELTIQNINNMYLKIKEDKVNFLKPIENHYVEKINNDNIDKNKHEVILNKESRLYKVYQQDKINIVSLHRYALNVLANSLIVNCTYDNLIEGIEYKDDNLFLLGIQWHPELEEKNIILFKKFIEEAQRRK